MLDNRLQADWGEAAASGSASALAPRPQTTDTMDHRFFAQPFVALDVETTGLVPAIDRVIEIGLVRYEGGAPVARRSWLVNPGRDVPRIVQELTGIDPEEVRASAPFEAIADVVRAELASAHFVVAYNAAFDGAFLEAEFRRCARSLPELLLIDPLVVLRQLEGEEPSMRLSEAAGRWGVELAQAHRATADAAAAAELLMQAAPHLAELTPAELLGVQLQWRAGHRARSRGRREAAWQAEQEVAAGEQPQDTDVEGFDTLPS